jgi:hypothetical protein
MKSQATRNCILEQQALARKRRIEALFCIPLGLLIAFTYADLAIALFGQ